MTRKFKALGLTLGAIAALIAVAAPAAQAETGALTSPVFPTIVTGPKVNVGPTFDIGAVRTVSCESKLDATLFGPTDPVTFTPTYNNCTSEPGGATPVTVTMNGCDYLVGFSKPGTTGPAAPTGLMHAWIQCPGAAQIEIHVYANAFAHAMNVSTCTYDIGPQGQVPAGIYHNQAEAGMIPDVLATVNAKFTARSTIGFGGAVCGGDPETQHLPITLTGQYTLQGFQDNNQVEGAQVPLDVG
ncbi:MAG TPA: hypothetical protein VFJ61_01725 [Solirubrobacterales bacterium]|nr:hypothetical protein [Solirubrobacterales bacterium]